MVVNDNAASLTPRSVFRFIASKLAPTEAVRFQRFCRVSSNTFTLVIDS
ncbi:hypothetical protein PS659_01718 [Pseudomonas fluorescens]|uniref:Uncharacterized protein n=1 Tax=Pseudomonas fluorescens TaxID=294 RepID=A0A5E6RXI7_PSEFL|nr:hypothetical protein PS659_01718 [Pseudomonas fluorescens]